MAASSTEAGNVFGKHLAGFELGELRSSYGFGVSTADARDHNFQVLVAFGTETYAAARTSILFGLSLAPRRGFDARWRRATCSRAALARLGVVQPAFRLFGSLWALSAAGTALGRSGSGRLWSCPEEYVSPMVWDVGDQSLFYPLTRIFGVEAAAEAVNVNALDEVANSSWFTNRIGLYGMSPAQVAAGPCVTSDDPATPWTVTGAKPNGANPGFVHQGRPRHPLPGQI